VNNSHLIRGLGHFEDTAVPIELIAVAPLNESQSEIIFSVASVSDEAGLA
jgi:hypothetical protein